MVVKSAMVRHNLATGRPIVESGGTETLRSGAVQNAGEVLGGDTDGITNAHVRQRPGRYQFVDGGSRY